MRRPRRDLPPGGSPVVDVRSQAVHHGGAVALVDDQTVADVQLHQTLGDVDLAVGFNVDFTSDDGDERCGRVCLNGLDAVGAGADEVQRVVGERELGLLAAHRIERRAVELDGDDADVANLDSNTELSLAKSKLSVARPVNCDSGHSITSTGALAGCKDNNYTTIPINIQ